MKPSISILCPTRGRPHFLKQLISSVENTVQDAKSIEFVFYLDDDDPTPLKFLNRLQKKKDLSIKTIVGERIVLSQMWNECSKVAEADILMHAGDDIIFRTKDWDKKIINAFAQYEDKIVFVYGKDGAEALRERDAKFGTHGFIHRNWVDTVGYFVPPYFSSDYNDTWLNDVGKMIERHLFVDIYTEHIHPGIGKYVWDQTHMDRKIRGEKDNVDQKYIDTLDLRIEDSSKLKSFIENYRS